MNNKITIELTPEQYEMVKKQLECQEVKKTPFDRVYKESYYFINDDSSISRVYDADFSGANRRYKAANYCTDKDLLQQQAYRETLNRLLWRFSMQNGGDEIDWSDCRQRKYCIYYNHKASIFKVDFFQSFEHFNKVYFISREIAQRAINEIIEPFCEKHPDFKF